MSFALPVEHLKETSTLLAFEHPRPAYRVHILLLPKQPIANLSELDPARDAAFLADLYGSVQDLVGQLGLESYRLIVNGGKYQDFPYLHFHLVSDDKV